MNRTIFLAAVLFSAATVQAASQQVQDFLNLANKHADEMLQNAKQHLEDADALSKITDLGALQKRVKTQINKMRQEAQKDTQDANKLKQAASKSAEDLAIKLKAEQPYYQQLYNTLYSTFSNMFGGNSR
jgi:undecaprenyl pyrophosphate synthase